MNFDPLSTTPNPFAVEFPSRHRRLVRRLWPAVRFLAVVAILFATLVGVNQQHRRWQLGRLTADLAELNPRQKQARLSLIAGYGPAAVTHLVAALNDDEQEVAKTAFRLLEQLQSSWATLDSQSQLERQQTLLNALGQYAADTPGQRGSWIVGMIQTILQDTAHSQRPLAREVNRLASQTLATVPLHGDAKVSSAGNEQSEVRWPVRVAAHTQPLPVNVLDVVPEPSAVAAHDSRLETHAGIVVPAAPGPAAPVVYRSDPVRLQPLPSGRTASLRQF